MKTKLTCVLPQAHLKGEQFKVLVVFVMIGRFPIFNWNFTNPNVNYFVMFSDLSKMFSLILISILTNTLKGPVKMMTVGVRRTKLTQMKMSFLIVGRLSILNLSQLFNCLTL